MVSVSMPNFIVIGAAKAGTTSLYHYLQQHPQVYMSPIKEPRFFCLENQALDWHGPGDKEIFGREIRELDCLDRNSKNIFPKGSVTSLDVYRSLFQKCSNEVAIGEASAWYLCHPGTPHCMNKYVPNIK